MRATGLIALVIATAACSGPQESPARTSADTTPPPEGATEGPGGGGATAGAVTREGLGRLLGPGPGHFFGIVTVEGVGDEETSRFQGWRIESLPSDTPGWLDVRVGDVVTGVNGITPLEQPEDALRVYEVLRVASEVRIDLIRDGERRAVRIPILDAEEPPPAGGGDAEEPPDTTPAPAEEPPAASE